MKHTAAEGRGEENKMKTVIVDAVGEPCPIPVVTFIALLELAKETLIEITQAEAFAPIYVRLAYTPA